MMGPRRTRLAAIFLPRLMLLVGLGLGLIGCGLQKPQPPRPADNPGPALAARFFAQGKQLEVEGDLPAALRAFQLAVTADPHHSAASARIRAVSTALQQQAEGHYQSARVLFASGNREKARGEALTALRLNPDHAPALDLFNRIRESESIPFATHTVSAGQSLSGIVSAYYGDSEPSAASAAVRRMNHLGKGAELRAGQILRLPFLEIAGNLKPDLHRSPQPDQPAEYTAQADDAVETDQATAYFDAGKDLYTEKRFAEAATEFEKAYNSRPEDTDAQQYLCLARIKVAMALFNRYLKNPTAIHYIMDAETAREQYAKLVKKHDTCATVLKQVTSTIYNQAMRRLSETASPDLAGALPLLRQVRFLDPTYDNIDRMIQDAERMNRKLQTL